MLALESALEKISISYILLLERSELSPNGPSTVSFTIDKLFAVYYLLRKDGGLEIEVLNLLMLF